MSYLNKQCWEVVRNGKVVRSKLTRPEAEHELFERVRDSQGCGVKSVSASPSFDHSRSCTIHYQTIVLKRMLHDLKSLR